MLKPKTFDISQSNIANLGTDLEKKVKTAASRSEHSWDHAGEQTGIQIWRIENFHVKPVPEKTYGQFYSGDSYIVLWTYKKGDSKQFNVHFWLGDHTSQDEAGTAAYKTVELDDRLGGLPVQYREVQGHESRQFLTYFPKGVRILEGGIDSGFHHVTATEYKPRLLLLSGTIKSVHVVQVNLSTSSLNSDDVFILDNGLEVFQWNGAHSNGGERLKAAQLVEAIKDERDGKATVSVLDEGKEDPKFWTLLGGQAEIAKKSAKVEEKREKVLMELSDVGGHLKFKEVARGKVHRSALKDTDVYVFDTGFEVFAWVGHKSSAAERKTALSYAEKYLKEHNKPATTPICRILQGGENEVFESSFD